MAIVTFETLREVQRKEKKSENLAELTDEFYAGVKDYFLRAAKTDANEGRNARSIFEDIIDRREKKILNQALRTVRMREKAEIKAMTTKERALFDTLVLTLGNFREHIDIDGNKFELKEVKTEEPEDIEEIIEHEKEAEEREEYVKVKLLEDVPEIVGADLHDYGP
ncbi:TPA: DNA replication complex GINS family protein, partial [archaeon]|nr:DNA replication complex GINS family protein [Candidatus Naiadarchaeales archaeon SRR2090153.bin1042]